MNSQRIIVWLVIVCLGIGMGLSLPGLSAEASASVSEPVLESSVNVSPKPQANLTPMPLHPASATTVQTKRIKKRRGSSESNSSALRSNKRRETSDLLTRRRTAKPGFDMSTRQRTYSTRGPPGRGETTQQPTLRFSLVPAVACPTPQTPPLNGSSP